MEFPAAERRDSLQFVVNEVHLQRSQFRIYSEKQKAIQMHAYYAPEPLKKFKKKGALTSFSEA